MDSQPKASNPSGAKPPPVWVVPAQAPGSALLKQLQALDVEVHPTAEGCQVAVVDFRTGTGALEVARLRTEVGSRDLLILAIVGGEEPAYRDALDAAVDGFVEASRLDRELLPRLWLLAHRQHERELAERHERNLAMLLELTSDYAQTRDATELLHKVTVRLADELQVDRCALWVIDEQRARGRVIATSDDKGMQAREIELTRYPEIQELLRTRKPVVLSDASVHPLMGNVQAQLAAQNVGAIAALPLAVQDRVLGVMLLRAGSDRRTFSPREMAFASTVAHATAIALRNARVLESAEARVADLARYEAFFTAFSLGVAVVNGDGTLASVNPAGARMLGVDAGAVRNRSLVEVLAPDSEDPIQEMLLAAHQGHVFPELDVAVVRGTFAIGAAPIGEGGRGAILSFRDVTHARQLQAELRKTKDFLEQLIDQAADAIIAADMKGQVIIFNKGAERICGYAAADVVGKLNVRQLYPPEMAEQLMRKIRAPEQGGPGRLELTRAEIITRSGERVPVNMTAALIKGSEGGRDREVATVGIFSDLRGQLSLEMKLSRTQERLAQTERTAVVAELAGTAAHELNQPLTSIMGYAELLRRRLAETDPAVRPVEIIYKEAERMAEIVRKIGKITRYETKAYVGESRIVDLDRSSGPEDG